MTALHLEIGFSVIATLFALFSAFITGALTQSFGSFIKWTTLCLLCGVLTFAIYAILVEALAWIFAQFGIVPESDLVFAVIVLVLSLLTSGGTVTTRR